ncbi:zinc finger BED domain-containing protein DAYSLEEPER-like isoform X1 [Nicotiana tabacum]|uniref:Zinc finger BED domain-containing protein DAYSLEEPER-like n=2 Tax=Nicotiana tabacum TaxID=4097 RepID=A0AC58SKX8_TOBAC
MDILLFVTVVLDHRYKIRYVKFIFAKSYGSVAGDLRSNKVIDTLSRLYNCYKDSSAENSDEILGGQVSTISEGDTGEIWKSQWEKYLQEQDNEGSKTNLERYLIDDLELAKDFNILSWWKDASKRYPIVSRIARDVLAIHVSTVASESAFSTSGRILDSYRSSLSPKTVEALICTQQWLRSTPKECNIEDILEKIQKLEIVEKEYPDNILIID